MYRSTAPASARLVTDVSRRTAPKQRLAPLPLAVALALAAGGPGAEAQTVVQPLVGAAATQTAIATIAPGHTLVTTGTLREGNAFNHFSALRVGQGDTVSLAVPQGAQWLVNIVRDERLQVDGLLRGQIAGGATGGNLLFIDSHGFAVGPQGRIQAGQLVLAAPSASVVDGLLSHGAGVSGTRVKGLLAGDFERSTTGAVRIDGVVQAEGGVQVMAGAGAGSAGPAVQVNGQIITGPRRAAAAVNLAGLHSLTPWQERDGVIDITTPGDVRLNGRLLADGDHWAGPGVVRVVAGGDLQLGSSAVLSASGARGTGQAGGVVSTYAQRNAHNDPGAVMRARGDGAGAGGFIEFSGRDTVTIGGMTLDASSDTGAAGLAYIDPATLVVSATNLTGGTDVLYEATESVTIASGVTVNTRKVASGADPTSAAVVSTGDSGDITIKAPSITVQSGAVLDASVVNIGSSWKAGDITLTATRSVESSTLVSVANADASIDVAGALKGGNITLAASVSSSATFGGSAGTIQQEALNLVLEELDAPLGLSLAYVEAKGDAKVKVQGTGRLNASGNLQLTAMGERSASAELQAEGSTKANLSAGFASVTGSTRVDVESGAQLTAGDNMSLVAASKTAVTMNAAAAGTTETDPATNTTTNNVASIVFAGARSDITTVVNVASGASLTSTGATGGVDVQACHASQYETAAEVKIYGQATAGVVGALSLHKSTTEAVVGGTVSSQGHVRVMAMNASSKNVISASSVYATKQEEENNLAPPESLEIAEADALDGARSALFSGFFAMAAAASEKADETSAAPAPAPAPAAAPEPAAAPAPTSSPAPSPSPSPSPAPSPTPAPPAPPPPAPALALAGALTWSQSDHTTRAVLSPGAVVTAGGDVVVDAQALVGRLQSVAETEAAGSVEKDGQRYGLAMSVNYASHTNTTRALVGAGTQINAGHVAVHAATHLPQFYTAMLPLDPTAPEAPPLEWETFTGAFETYMGGTDVLFEGFNTRVGATSSAQDLAASGAVSLFFVRNDTRAWVDTDARITTTVTDGEPWTYGVREVNFDSDVVRTLVAVPPSIKYTLDKDLSVLGDFVAETRQAPSGLALEQIDFERSFDAPVVVRAQNHMQTLHYAGGNGPESAAKGKAVGGTFSMVSHDNTTMAGIADRAQISAERLDVKADTQDWVWSLSPTSGQGAGVAANGIASYNSLRQTTRASISREALVTAPTVNVDARLAVGVVAVTGAVTQSESSGVGIGLAINEVSGDTRAYLGDNDTDGGGAQTAEGAQGYVRTGALGVKARTEGMLLAVGVAGALAGKEPPPAEPDPGDTPAPAPSPAPSPSPSPSPAPAPAPAPKSTGEQMAEKVATQSADEQKQLDGDAATTQPVAEAAAPAKGTGTDQAAADQPAADKPPSMAISGAGAIVTNFSDLDTTALVDGARVTGIGTDTTTVGVRALSDLIQVSVAGGGALSMAKNTSTTFSAAIGGAIAIQKSDDDTRARIVNSTLEDLADLASSLVVQAIKSGERTAVATGISASLSKGSTTNMSVAGSASVTTSTDDTRALLENTDVAGDVASPTAMGVQVVAYDRSRIGAGGGALSVSNGKGAAGMGAAISVVNAEGSTQALVHDGSIQRAHDLAVLALSAQKVVGVAAVGGVQTDASSKGQLMGSFVYNHIGNTLTAGVRGDATVNLTGDLALQAGGAPTDATLDALAGTQRSSAVTDYELSSTSNGYTSDFKNAVGGESIVGVAGTLSASLGGNATSLGMSYVHNDIRTTYDAELDAGVTATGQVSVTALSRADIVGVSAGVGATKGKFSGMGSASVNLIGQRTQAQVTGGSVTAAGLALQSDTRGNSFALAGNLSFTVGGGNGKAAGAAVAVTQTGTRTYSSGTSNLGTRAAGNTASIDSASVSVGTGTVQVQANNTSHTRSIAASGAASDGNVGFAGTVTANELGDTTSAIIDNSLVTAGTVTVRAGEAAAGRTASIQSLAGGLSASKGYSGALAMGVNTINTVRTAQVTGSNLIVSNAVTVQANAEGSIKTISATLAGGQTYAAAGSFSVNTLNADIYALYDSTSDTGGQNSLRGTASSLRVLASGTGTIESFAGAVSGSGTGAIGGALAINRMGEGTGRHRVRASLQDIQLLAPASVEVDASLTSSIGTVAVSGSGAGTAALTGSVTTNTIEAEVQAQMLQAHQTTNSGTVTVRATNDADIAALAGSVSGAGETAFGVAIATNSIGGEVSSTVTDSTLAGTGAVVVDATTSGTLKSAAAGMAGGGTAGVSASNTTNAITSTVLAQITRVTQTAAAASVRVQAQDSSTIQSFAGSVGVGSSAGGGAAFAINFLGRTALDADSSKVVKAEVVDSSLRSSGAVQIKGLSTSVIESIALGVAGSGTTAGSGSSTTNLLEDEITASWSGGSLNGSATSLRVQADDLASVSSLAGNVAGAGTAAFGAAIAVNQVGSVVKAQLSGMTLASTGTAVTVDADLRGEIESVAASGGAGGTGAATGSFTTNEITASVKAQTLNLTQSTSGGAFAVSADNDADILSVAGTVSGGGTAAAGVAVSVNAIGGDVTALVTDSTLRATGAVTVDATSSGLIKSVAAGVSGGGTAALSGSNTTNAITSTVLARMSSVTQSVASSSLRVQAQDSSTIRSFAGSVSGGGTAAGGAAFALNFLGRTATDDDSSKLVKAEVLNSTVLSAGTVQVRGLSTSVIESMAVAVGGSGSVAVTGSNTTNLLEDEVLANWTGGSFTGTASALTVQADDAATVRTLAGNVSGSGAAAFGAAIAVNRIGSLAHATLSGVTLAVTGAAITVDGKLRGEIESLAASGAAAAGASVNGSFTTNEVKASVKAQALDFNQTADGGAFTVSATNDADIDSLAGTISGSGSAAVGVAVSVNDIGGDVTARMANASVRTGGAVAVTADTSGTIRSVAAGMAGGSSAAAAGSNTTNGITSTVLAQMSSMQQWGEPPTTTVRARDTSTIESLAGTVAGGGAAGGGAALAQNFLGRNANNEDGSKLVKAEVSGGVMRTTGQMLVEASSASTIRSLSMAAGAGGTLALTGSNTTNLLEDEVIALWDSAGMAVRPANAVKVSARHASTIDSLAGNLAGSVGVSAGAALAVNRIGTQTLSTIKGNSGVYSRDTHVDAESDAQINTVAVGMAAGMNGAQGSVAVSVIDSDTRALMGGDNAQLTNVAATGTIAVTAHSRDRIKALAGTASLGGLGVGLGGGIVTNVISSDTVAGVSGSNTHVTARGQGNGITVNESDLASNPDLSQVTELSNQVLTGATLKTRTHKGVAVQATSIQQIGAMTAVASGGAAGAAGASINVDHIGGTTRAYVVDMPFMNDDPNSVGTAAENVAVMAANHAMVASSATAVAIGSVGVSGAMGTEIIDRSTKAEAINSVLRSTNDVTVKAVSTNAVVQISAGAAGGAAYGVAGSGDVVLLKGNTQALVDRSRVFANNLSVVADGSNLSNLVAGSASYGGALLGSGVGLSFTVNVSGSTVRALIDDTDVRADGAVVVDADNRTTSLSVSSAAAVGGSTGVAVGASVSIMEGATEAAVTGSTTISRRTRATGLVASAEDAAFTLNLASPYDLVDTSNQGTIRLVLSDVNGQVSSGTAVVTLTDGENTVTAVRQSDGSYLANASTLNDGVLMAQVVIAEGGVNKVATTTLSKSTGINASDLDPVVASLPAAQTRISTLSSFAKVDTRNQQAVNFVLKSDTGPTADTTASVIVSDGTRHVAATLNADGSYTADVSSLGDGTLTALASTTLPDASVQTARVTFQKESGAASLRVTADETVTLNHNAGQVGVGGVNGVGTSANLVIGKSAVDATLSATSVRVSGELTVAAERTADIDMITATSGGGGNVGVSGAVGVLLFGSAPDSNASTELNGNGGTLSQVSGATKADRSQGTGSGLSSTETTALNNGGRYDTQAAFTGATGSHRTSATVSAPSIVAGSLAVRSLDRTAVDNNAGGVALGGAAGVSAGVAVTLLGGANNAAVSSSNLIVGGGVSVESGMRTPSTGKPSIESRAIAGSGGFVGVGAAVSVATNATASSASFTAGLQAGGAVNVRALDQTSLLSEAVGASTGALAVGAVVATAEQTGSVSTSLGGTLAGQGFSATAERDASTMAKARGGVAGVVAGSGAAATASDAGSVTLSLASGTSIDAGSGSLSLLAKSNPSADTDAFGVSVAAGAAVGVSVALSEVETEVQVLASGPVSLSGGDLLVSAVLGSGQGAVTAEATAGGGGLLLGLQGAAATASNQGLAEVSLGSVTLAATGHVAIAANDAMTASASATGVGVGFVGAGVAVARTESTSNVTNRITALGGRVAGDLTLSARGDESVDADAVAGTGGVVAGAGAEATVSHQQAVSMVAGTAAAGLRVTGATTLSADRRVRYDSQTETVNASAFGGSGAVTRASLTGSALARLDDDATLTGSQLRVLATNDVERSDLTAVSARGGGGGVIAGAGADAVTVINGTATAELGDDVTLVLGGASTGLLELRAYNQLRGSSLGRLDVGGAIPIALVDTEIRSTATADARLGARNDIEVAGEVYVNAMSYVDIEANTITKTYGAAAGAQGDALAHATVNNRVTVGTDTVLLAEGAVSLLAGQDRDFWRNKSFITARADLFNHAAVPVSVNPDADAKLTLNNNVMVLGDEVRSGGSIQVGGIEGTYVVQGRGKVSDWTRDVGELIGISSEYGSSVKELNADTYLSGLLEAGYGNKQIIVIQPNGQLDASKTQGNIRYTITTEDLAATGVAYLDTLYAQLKNYGDNDPTTDNEVETFVKAEIAFYLDSLVREGFATREVDPATGLTEVVPLEKVPGTFLTLQNVRAGSGNVELFGHNVTGNASIVARADSEILIDNKSPMNIRVKDLVIDSSGGFTKYNGVYLTQSNGSDIATYNRDTKTGLAFTVDSIDTRGGAAAEQLPSLKVLNSYQSTGATTPLAVPVTAADGSIIDLRQDQLRAPEIRVNGLLYNKLGPVILSNTAGSISVIQEDSAYVPRIDGLEVQVNAGKNIVLSSPSVSQSVGGSPENLYAVAYTTDQQTKLDNMGVVRCGTARAGVAGSMSFDANCTRNGAGGIFASGGIFMGARYLNINGTIQSGQPDYKVTLTSSSVSSIISAWEKQWTENRGTYQAQGRSSLVQVAGRRPTDNESEIQKQFANGTITAARRNELLTEMANRRLEPIVHYDAESDRLKVAATNVTGGLVEVVGSIINTGGGVIRALDGHARFDIDNQTGYAMDLLGLDTGGDAGVVRITDLAYPVYSGSNIVGYRVTTYQRDAAGAYKATTTAGRGGSVIGTPGNSTLTSPNALRPELRATFSYAPQPNSTYVWSAGYEYGQEKRYWYKKSSALFGAIKLGSVSWDSVDVINKTSSAMPEGIYVTTANAPAQKFSMDMMSYATAAEKEIYYRKWKKCSALCLKTTHYIDYRTEVGRRDVFTQRVRADNPIAIELVGYSTGLIDITSIGDIGISGALKNTSGLVSIDSANGRIQQLSGGTSVSGNDLRFYAAKGIGEEGAPVNVITGTGSFTAQSDSGNVAFQSLGGAMRINQVSTTGKVWLMGDEDIVGVNPNTVHVSGSRVELSAPRGGIGAFNADGSVKSTLNIQTEDSAGGGITAHAAGGIALKQGTGNLWVNQVASSGGDVYIETAGDLIDNNRNETRDVRTEEELLALWNAAALQGTDAQTSVDRTLRNTRLQYRRYWSLRNASATSINPSTGLVTTFSADPVDPNFEFQFSSVERERLAATGLTTTQIDAMEDARTDEFKGLHALYGSTTYQVRDDHIITAVNTANLAAGKPAVDALSTWSDTELRSPLPKAIFSKSTTDTQTRIEEPNVVGNRVVLRPGGKIGRDEGAVTIDLRKAGGLTTEDQLTIMSAESDDMTLDRNNWRLTVVKKDTFNVLSNRLNVLSNGFVYLGADTTDAYPTGGNANLEQVTGAGEVRIKVSGSILNASNSTASVIQGHKAILEAASGSIGTAAKPVTMTLTGGGTPSAATLVARANDGIWIRQTGDIRAADLYSPGMVSLTATGSIIDARGTERTRSIEAGEAELVALAGTIGTAANPMVLKMSATGGVNATTPAGYSMYLQGAETGLTVKNLSSGMDIDLYSPTGTLRARGTASAAGRLDAEAAGTGDIVMESGSSFVARAGDVSLSADDIGLSRVDASRTSVAVARGSITDTSSVEPTVNIAGRGVTLLATGSIGTSEKPVDVFTKEITKVVAVGGGNVWLDASQASLRIGQVSAGGDAGVASNYSLIDDKGTLAQAVEGVNVELRAGQDIGQSITPISVRTAANGQIRTVQAGGSAYLRPAQGLLRIGSASAATGQLVLNGTLGGLTVLGPLSAAQGVSLSAGSQALTLGADADVSNGSGSVVLQGSTITMANGASVNGGAGTVVMSATGNIALTGISSAHAGSGAIVVSTTNGAISDAGDTDIDIAVRSATGGVVLTAAGHIGDPTAAAGAAGRALETNVPVIVATSRTGGVLLAQGTTDTRDVVVSAVSTAEVSAQGNLVGTRVASTTGDVSVSSALGEVSVANLSAARDLTVIAAGRVTTSSATATRHATLTSSGTAAGGGGMTLPSVTAGGALTISAAGATSDSTLGNVTARGGALTLSSGRHLTLTTGSATGLSSASAGGQLSLGSLTSSAGAVSASAGSTLGFTTLSAATGLSASAAGAITGNAASTRAGTAAITSTGGGVQLATVTGPAGIVVSGNSDVSLTSATASAGTLSVTSSAGGLRYGTLSARGVHLTSGGLLAGTTPATGVQGGVITSTEVDPLDAIRVTAAQGQVSLGALTATSGRVVVQSTAGPLITGNVTARAMSLDSGAGLSGGALSATLGDVQLTARNGSVAYTSATASGRVTMAAQRTAGSTAATTISGGAITARGTTALAGAPYTIDLSTAAGGISTGALSATTGNISVLATGGAFTGTTVAARTGLVATAGQGLTLTSYAVTAGGATLSAGAPGMTLTSGTTTGNQTLTSAGSATLGNLTASAGALSVTSSAGGLRYGTLSARGVHLTSGGLLAGTTPATGVQGGVITSTEVDPLDAIRVTAAQGQVSLGALTATSGRVVVQSTAGPLITGNVTARAMSLDSGAGLSGGALSATLGDVQLTARNGSVAYTSAAASGRVTMAAQRTAGSTAATTISGGAITARGTTALAGAPYTIDLSTAAGGISTGALSATTGNISVLATGGAFTGTTVAARTGLVATAGQGLTLTSYAVTAGGATLSAGAPGMTLTSGTTTGNQTLTSAGSATLGNLTASAGALSATSTAGGLSFGALRASGSIGLSAASTFTAGANAGYSLIGTSLSAASVNAIGATGNVQIGTLSAPAAVVRATFGGLRITTITLLPRPASPASSTLVAGNTSQRFVPVGY